MEMVKEVERDLYEMGVRYQTGTVQDQQVADDPDYQTIELSGYAYTIKDVCNFDFKDAVGYMGHDERYYTWMRNEATERINSEFKNRNPGYAWKYREDFWGKYLRNGVFAYSYAERWLAQIPYVIHELKARPNTRQAIITMYDRHQDILSWGGHDRVPCSVSYQFIGRDGRLSIIYNQRSCDFVKFFIADIYFTMRLLWYVSNKVSMIAGDFTHFLGSLHAFAGDLKDKDIF
jgi:thymidylate synthase